MKEEEKDEDGKKRNKTKRWNRKREKNMKKRNGGIGSEESGRVAHFHTATSPPRTA